MTDSKYRGQRLDVSQFYAILDDLAGITELQRQPINEKELDYCEPSPLPRAMLDRLLEKIRSMEAVEVAPTPRRWWSRPAAALPIAISVLLLAAAPIYFFVWSGRNSTNELTFEHAIQTVFDQAVPMDTRRVAYLHVAVSIKVGISAIKNCALKDPRLRADADATFNAIKQMCVEPPDVASLDPIPSGRFKALLSTIRGEDPETLGPKINAIRDFIRSAEFGIDALSRGAKLGPQFQQRYEIQMDHIRKRLKW